MLKASKEYKEVMSRPMRNRGYVSISLGVVNQNAQGSAKTDSEHNYFSNNNVFEEERETYDYATLEQGYTKADGKMLFPPRESESAQYVSNGFVSNAIRGRLKVTFDKAYDIKGFSIEFGESFPTRFKLVADNNEYTFDNDSTSFSCQNRFDSTTSIEIIPLTMVGGEQRLHIHYLLMGIGLSFKNNVVKDTKVTTFVSFISSELSYNECNSNVIDYSGNFDIDNDDSFMDYLEPMQPVEISFGIDIDGEKQEWLQVSKTFLKSWTSKDGVLSFTSTDRLSLLDTEYSQGNVIQTRTVYSEIEKILLDLGYEPEDISIDPFLHAVTFENPLPVAPHKECLQLLCNYSRCAFFEDNNAILNVKANFENVLDPDDLIITSSAQADWGNAQNVIIGAETEYGDLSNKSFSLNGKRQFAPHDRNLLKSAFVSSEIAGAYGTFINNPFVQIEMPALYNYYGLQVSFGGVVPKLVKLSVGDDESFHSEFYYEDLEKDNVFMENFEHVKRIKLEVLESEPDSRVVINKMAFGMVTDFKLTKNDMFSKPAGTKEQQVKGVKVKIYTFETDAEGNIVEVDDDNYYTLTMSDKGNYVLCENQLVSTVEQAQLLAEWLGNYYANNVSYQVSYRGDPRVQSNDIIYLDSDYKTNLQVEVEKSTLSFNGAFSGDLDLRRAIKLS